MELLYDNTYCKELLELDMNELELLKLCNPVFYFDLQDLLSRFPSDAKVSFLDFHRLRITPADKSKNELWITLVSESDYWCNGKRVRNLRDAISFF
jgi:hypothetical protein